MSSIYYNDPYWGTRLFLYHPQGNSRVYDLYNGHRLNDARHGVHTRSSLLVTRRDASQRIDALEPFTGSNIAGLWIEEDYYVTFSYRISWPLFIYDRIGNQWFENSDRISMTTSHHRNYLHPRQDTKEFSREALIEFLNTVTTLPKQQAA